MKYIMTIGFLLASISMSAQQVWTLQQCISHAVAHNITIQRQCQTAGDCTQHGTQQPSAQSCCQCRRESLLWSWTDHG